MAFSKITTKAMSGDTLEAGDIAANSIGASELADNAVDAGAIATGAVTATAFSSTALASVENVKPHIQPGVLYPAIDGKLLDCTTSHSGDYGTAQADGHSYYWTSIKGSRAIKDPRIGAHFGCQRHMFKSRQLLHQESAAHNEEVYSLDGRDWARVVNNEAKVLNLENDSHGLRVVDWAPDGLSLIHI